MSNNLISKSFIYIKIVYISKLTEKPITMRRPKKNPGIRKW